jgi:hypothetical protein
MAIYKMSVVQMDCLSRWCKTKMFCIFSGNEKIKMINVHSYWNNALYTWRFQDLPTMVFYGLLEVQLLELGVSVLIIRLNTFFLRAFIYSVIIAAFCIYNVAYSLLRTMYLICKCCVCTIFVCSLSAY